MIKNSVGSCLSENQKLFFNKRGEYSMVANKSRRENVFLEFIQEKGVIKHFFSFLEEKHSVLFDSLVDQVKIIVSR